MTALLSVARRYVIADAGWNLLSFAARARNLTGGNLVFRTLRRPAGQGNGPGSGRRSQWR